MKLRKWILGGLTAVMACSLVACGSSADSQAPKEAGKSEKELTIWVEKVFSDDANAAMEARIKEFGEKNGIKVNYEFIGATDFMTKLNAAIEAGTTVPDITTAAVTKVLNYYPNIPYSDVSALVDEINGDRPYFDSIYEGSKIDGKSYFVPFTSSSTMMFVRKDKLAEKGITKMPATWEEVFATAETVADPANGFYGLGLGCGPTDEDGENMFRTILTNEGSNIFDKEGNITIDNENTIKLLNKYKELYDNEIIPPSASTWDPGSNNSSYLMEEAAIVFNAPTLFNALKNDETKAELFANTEVLTPPAGNANATELGFVTGFSIMNACKDTETATALIQYLMEKEWYDSYVEITAPVFAPLFKDMEGSGIWAEGVNSQVINYAKNASGYYGYDVESIEGRAIAAKSYFTFPVAEMMNKVVTNTMSPEEAVADAVKKIEEIQSTMK